MPNVGTQPWRHKTYAGYREHFESLVEKLPDAPGCWLWTGYAYQKKNVESGDASRRGAFCYKGKFYQATHVSWMFYRSKTRKVPSVKKKWILHKCDVGLCVNPDHLYRGTLAENNADKRKRKRCWNVPRRKLTLEQARECLSSKEMGTVLAKRFGVTPYCIWAIRHGKSWSTWL